MASSSDYSAIRTDKLPKSNFIDERYTLGGVNQVTPDAIIKNGEASVALNCRLYEREDQGKRVAIKTRKGCGFYSLPVGHAVDQQQTSVTGAADQTFNKTSWIAQKFTAGSSGRLSMIELNLKKNTGTGTVIAALYSDNSGTPGSLIATSGTAASNVVSTYAYVKFRFIEAPSVTSATNYWVVLYAQDDNVNFYNISSTTNTTLAKTSSNSGGTWSSSSFSLNFKTYVCTSGLVLGRTRRYASNGTKETIFAHGTSIYKIDDTTGVLTTLKTGMSALATEYHFDQFNDKTIMVNGVDTPLQYDGTTVSNLTGLPAVPRDVISHKNRLFFMSAAEPTKIFFSDLANELSYPSVNFFYVPTPKSADKLTAWTIFQDNLILFTRESKYVLVGSDIASFTLRQSIGIKGATNGFAVTNDRNYVYFCADDGIYRWNGSTDNLLSEKVQPEFKNIADVTKVHLGFWNNQLRVYYPSASSSVQNQMMLLDIVYSQWFIDDKTYTMMPLNLPQDAGNPLLEFSSLVGAAYYAEQGFNQLGAPIYFKYWTSYNKYISAASKDRIRTFRPLIKPSGFTFTMQIGRDFDFQNVPQLNDYTVTSSGATWGGGYTWGASSSNPTQWGSSSLIDDKASMSGRGKFTQYRFERYGANTPVELYGWVALVKSGRIS